MCNIRYINSIERLCRSLFADPLPAKAVLDMRSQNVIDPLQRRTELAIPSQCRLRSFYLRDLPVLFPEMAGELLHASRLSLQFEFQRPTTGKRKAVHRRPGARGAQLAPESPAINLSTPGQKLHAVDYIVQNRRAHATGEERLVEAQGPGTLSFRNKTYSPLQLAYRHFSTTARNSHQAM